MRDSYNKLYAMKADSHEIKCVFFFHFVPVYSWTVYSFDTTKSKHLNRSEQQSSLVHVKAKLSFYSKQPKLSNFTFGLFQSFIAL